MKPLVTNDKLYINGTFLLETGTNISHNYFFMGSFLALVMREKSAVILYFADTIIIALSTYTNPLELWEFSPHLRNVKNQ